MSTPQLINFEVLFKSNDPRGQAMLKSIEELGEFTVERFEAEWFLFSMLARKAAIRADHLRRDQVMAQRRRDRRKS